MREITANTGLLLVGVDGGGGEFAAAGGETGAFLHPFADALDPLVTRRQVAEGLIRQLLQLVRLAITTGVEIGQNFDIGKSAIGISADVFRFARRDARIIHVRLIGDLQRTGVGAQPQQAVVEDRVVGNCRWHRLTEAQRFADDGLAGSGRGVNVEDEIGGLTNDLVAEIDGELEADHGGGLVGVSCLSG
jgi:hypothetical protein